MPPREPEPSGAYVTDVTYVPYKTDIGAARDVVDVIYVDLMPGEAVDRYADEPLYLQLAAILRRQITSGALVRLDPLPSETTLTQRYEVSRETVRRAVAVLRDEGLVFTVAQRGTYVGPRP